VIVEADLADRDDASPPCEISDLFHPRGRRMARLVRVDPYCGGHVEGSRDLEGPAMPILLVHHSHDEHRQDTRVLRAREHCGTIRVEARIIDMTMRVDKMSRTT
jgi:hypothetical protein